MEPYTCSEVHPPFVLNVSKSVFPIRTHQSLRVIIWGCDEWSFWLHDFPQRLSVISRSMLKSVVVLPAETMTNAHHLLICPSALLLPC